MHIYSIFVFLTHGGESVYWNYATYSIHETISLCGGHSEGHEGSVWCIAQMYANEPKTDLF